MDLLRQRVKVRLEDTPENIPVFSNEEIAVFRNGKAKKNDPPIPADWAPISGSGKRLRREEEDEPVKLDPIRFRYSTEAVVEEKQEEKQEEKVEEAAEEKMPRPRRPKKLRPEGQNPEQFRREREPAVTADDPDRRNRRRPPYRRHRKPKPGGEG